MVRRDDDGSRFLEEGTNPTSCCEDPAGESPVSVSGNAPSSRIPAHETDQATREGHDTQVTESRGPSADHRRGWGQYFRTGNASDKFSEVDRYVVWRMKRMRMHRKGRHLKPGEARRWNESYFSSLGLVHLHGTVQYPEAV